MPLTLETTALWQHTHTHTQTHHTHTHTLSFSLSLCENNNICWSFEVTVVSRRVSTDVDTVAWRSYKAKDALNNFDIYNKNVALLLLICISSGNARLQCIIL